MNPANQKVIAAELSKTISRILEAIPSEIDTAAATHESVGSGIPPCPNGHHSEIPPKRLPELFFAACPLHHPTAITWNRFCPCCGRGALAPARIYWKAYRIGGALRGEKKFCGQCGAKMIEG